MGKRMQTDHCLASNTQHHSNDALLVSFTFNAVPSAIAHAGCKTVLVECTDTFVIDLEDLEKKIKSTGSKCFILSYMRGRVPDVDAVVKLCQEHGVYLIEDAAHAYGCEWKGKKIGVRDVLAA